jgi:hypothetical protein
MPTQTILGGINQEETQLEIKDLTQAIYDLANGLAFLMNVKGVSADLRATIINTVATTISSGTVTTVSTLSNVAGIGGFAPNNQIPALMNMTAQSNINNIIIT